MTPFREFIFQQFGMGESAVAQEYGSDFVISLKAAFEAGRKAEQAAVVRRVNAAYERFRKSVEIED